MALTGTVRTGKPVEETLHPATCVSVIDLGTHRNDRFGKDEHKVMLQWELADEEREYEGETYRVKITQEFSLTMGTKSNLRKLLESWFGKKMTDEVAATFDVTKVAGRTCMIQTVNVEKGGKTYCNIAAIVPAPKGTVVPAPLAKIVVFEMGMPLPADIPDWIEQKITSAPEYLPAAIGADLPANSSALEEAPF